MRQPWIILMALAIAGTALAHDEKAEKAGDPKAPPRTKATPVPVPRTGPSQAGGGASPAAETAAKAAPAEAPKPAK